MTTGSSSAPKKIAAVVLAAGLSRRMGSPKLLLPWKNTTVIGQVVDTLEQAGIGEIAVVAGAMHQAFLAVLARSPAQVIFNPRYTEDSMAVSLQAGLGALSGEAEAALVVLGDQPQMQVEVIETILAFYERTPAVLVVPSYQMRRGHPWLIHRSLWDNLRVLAPEATLRHFLAIQAHNIHYVNVTTSSILQDLDTPQDYARNR